MSGYLQNASVQRVQRALGEAGSTSEVVELSDTARTAEDAARALGCELGAIVKSLVFTVGGRPVMALVAGDRRCDTAALAAALGLDGKVARADADTVREATGFAIGGVAPSATTCRSRSTPACSASRRSGPRPATITACSRRACRSWSA